MAQPAERLLGDPELQFHSPAKAAGGHAGARRIAILTPVLDDWESFTCLISDIARYVDSTVAAIDVVAVDDGSVQHLTAGDLASLDVGDSICSITVIRLALNLGHQRAIAVGLSWIAKREDLDARVDAMTEGYRLFDVGTGCPRALRKCQRAESEDQQDDS